MKATRAKVKGIADAGVIGAVTETPPDTSLQGQWQWCYTQSLHDSSA